MRPVRLSGAGLALLVATLLLAGAFLGSVGSAWTEPRPTPSPTSPPPPSVSASAAPLPGADVAGADIDRLPRYPGSVRSAHELIRAEGFLLTATEYLAAASVEDVRTFYQGVITEHGWERADIGFSNGEWSYVLVDGSTEALIEIELIRGLVEIDLQLSEPIPDPTPQPSPVPTAPPPPPAPPPTDDDDDGGDETDDDDAGTDD